MTGRSAFRRRSSSSMISEAWALPPGLLTRSTTALMSLRCRSSRTCARTGRPPPGRPPPTRLRRQRLGLRHRQRQFCFCRAAAGPRPAGPVGVFGDRNLRKSLVLPRLAGELAQFLQRLPLVSQFRDQPAVFGRLGADPAFLVQHRLELFGRHFARAGNGVQHVAPDRREQRRDLLPVFGAEVLPDQAVRWPTCICHAGPE